MFEIYIEIIHAAVWIITIIFLVSGLDELLFDAAYLAWKIYYRFVLVRGKPRLQAGGAVRQQLSQLVQVVCMSLGPQVGARVITLEGGTQQPGLFSAIGEAGHQAAVAVHRPGRKLLARGVSGPADLSTNGLQPGRCAAHEGLQQGGGLVGAGQHHQVAAAQQLTGRTKHVPGLLCVVGVVRAVAQCGDLACGTHGDARLRQPGLDQLGRFDPCATAVPEVLAALDFVFRLALCGMAGPIPSCMGPIGRQCPAVLQAPLLHARGGPVSALAEQALRFVQARRR